jgi:hypothetical protein
MPGSFVSCARLLESSHRECCQTDREQRGGERSDRRQPLQRRETCEAIAFAAIAS